MSRIRLLTELVYNSAYVYLVALCRFCSGATSAEIHCRRHHVWTSDGMGNNPFGGIIRVRFGGYDLSALGGVAPLCIYIFFCVLERCGSPHHFIENMSPWRYTGNFLRKSSRDVFDSDARQVRPEPSPEVVATTFPLGSMISDVPEYEPNGSSPERLHPATYA